MSSLRRAILSTKRRLILLLSYALNLVIAELSRLPHPAPRGGGGHRPVCPAKPRIRVRINLGVTLFLRSTAETPPPTSDALPSEAGIVHMRSKRGVRSFEPCVVRTAYLRRVFSGVRWFFLSKAGVSPDPERKRRTVLVRWVLGSKTQL